jgi:hypothetical protein
VSLAVDPARAGEDIAAFQRRLGRLATDSTADLSRHLAMLDALLADPTIPAERRPVMRVERATVLLLLAERRARERS